MIKRFIKDNRGQVLYAVIVTVMFMGVVSMITMGLTLSNYRAALQKQQHVTDYYAADAAAEMLRINGDAGDTIDAIESSWDVDISEPTSDNGITYYIITNDTVTLEVGIKDKQFKHWEVSYHAVQTENDEANPVQ